MSRLDLSLRDTQKGQPQDLISFDDPDPTFDLR